MESKNHIYFEKKPIRGLENIVDCFWSYNYLGDENGFSRIVPDNRADILFFEKTKEFKLCGPMTSYIHSTSKAVKGVRLKLNTLSKFLNVPLSEFTDKIIPTKDIGSKNLNSLISCITADLKSEEYISKVEDYLIENCSKFQSNEVVDFVIDAIGKGVSLKEIKNKLGFSEQYTRRLFKKYTGISMKKFERIQRLQNVISSNEKENFLDQVLSYGYYDQSHFINDCKLLTGLTPTDYFI